MSFFGALFTTALRANLASRRTWCLVLLLPLLTFGLARLAPAQEIAAPVQVGVVLPREGGGDFWKRLEGRSGLVVSFQAAGLEQARRRVALGRWDCALVLPEDFQERLDRQELEGLFTLLTGPGSAVYPLVRETVSACVAECISPAMAEGYLLDSGILTEVEAVQARLRLRESLLDRDRVLVALETWDGAPMDPLALADRGVDNLLAGAAAVLLLVWALFAAMDLGRWLDSPFARRLAPLQGSFLPLLARLTAALTPALCSGALALLALERPLPRILALIPYLAFWGAAALALARWRAGWTALPVLLPLAPVLGLLLPPVLLDVSVLFPALAPAVRWSPVTLYLRAGGGSWGDGLVLVAGAAAILALAWAAETKKKPAV